MFLTRTLGLSCAYKVGVISHPEVSIIEYKSCFKYLILASDGFWSVEENDEAVKYFEKWQKGGLEGLAGALMGEAVRRWSSKNVLMDDITLIFVGFN
jgi:serine/threonine protein phosphatase PrpC